MTRKDFQLIADELRWAINAADSQSEIELIGALAKRFADRLADNNPRFDRARFIKACGVEV